MTHSLSDEERFGLSKQWAFMNLLHKAQASHSVSSADNMILKQNNHKNGGIFSTVHECVLLCMSVHVNECV